MPQIVDGWITLTRITGSRELVIASHGGYTPAGRIFSGSGSTTIPTCVREFRFYSEPDDTTKGSAIDKIAKDPQAVHAARQAVLASLNLPLEPYVAPAPGHFSYVLSGTSIINYSLTNNSKYDFYAKAGGGFNVVRDVITIGAGKVHLSDIWNFFKRERLSYDVVHYGACRSNKNES